MNKENNPKYILQPNVMLKLCESDEGKRLVRETVSNARTAMATQGVLNYLAYELNLISRQMSPQEQQMVANIIYHCLFVAKHGDLLKYLATIPDDLCDFGEVEQPMGNA
jgi:hypothetical protein